MNLFFFSFLFDSTAESSHIEQAFKAEYPKLLRLSSDLWTKLQQFNDERSRAAAAAAASTSASAATAHGDDTADESGDESGHFKCVPTCDFEASTVTIRGLCDRFDRRVW